MLNLGQLVNTVQKNCHISDARHAGDFTLCIFLLKMREFYRWENEIPFTRDLSKAEVGEWLHERERMWTDIEANSFESVSVDGEAVDPFDADRINNALTADGYVYSGGYGRFSKPHFFLGELGRKETRNGFTIYVSSCEYARDLEAPPAMLQGKTIFVRQESVRRFLWEKIEEQRWTPANETMQRALGCYGADSNIDTLLDVMTHNETETMILHELGEGLAGELLGGDWEKLLTTLSRSKAEIMVRAVRDLLADCLSTLPGLLQAKNNAALHFYFANFTGMRKYLFPEAIDAYRRWVIDQDMDSLRVFTENGKTSWLHTARTLVDIYNARSDDAGVEIEKFLEDKRH